MSAAGEPTLYGNGIGYGGERGSAFEPTGKAPTRVTMSENRKTVMTLPGLLAVVSILMNVGNFAYTTRTYAVTHRPYIGIGEANLQFSGNPPQAMVWSLNLKNVGPVPGWVLTEEHVATLTTEGRVTTLPMHREPGEGRFLLFPGQPAGLTGSVSDAALGKSALKDILTGHTVLDVRVRLSYQADGALFGKNEYHYMAKSRLRVDTGPPTFFMLSAEAD